MKLRILAIALLSVFLFTATGCKNEVDDFIGMIDEMADIAEENEGDCEAMSEALTKYLEENEDKIKEVTDKIKEDDKMTSGQQEDMEAASERFTAATEGCPEAGFALLGLLAPLME